MVLLHLRDTSIQRSDPTTHRSITLTPLFHPKFGHKSQRNAEQYITNEPKDHLNAINIQMWHIIIINAGGHNVQFYYKTICFIMPARYYNP